MGDYPSALVAARCCSNDEIAGIGDEPMAQWYRPRRQSDCLIEDRLDTSIH